ncbi:MAG: hypothetical protein KF873_12455 [Gemmataceae bacterium]|nr:hypothetical protein [Gemmataceae bacterium]
MQSFRDNAGRAWTVAINVAAVKRVRGLVGVDLYKLIDDGFKPLAALVGDPVQLADVLYCLCKDEADAKSISDEDFGRALAGDAITLAADAFVEELIDFFPDARARASLTKVLAAGRKVRDKLMDHAEVVIDRLDPAAEASKLIASFGNSPASSGSTPAPSPSANS